MDGMVRHETQKQQLGCQICLQRDDVRIMTLSYHLFVHCTADSHCKACDTPCRCALLCFCIHLIAGVRAIIVLQRALALHNKRADGWREGTTVQLSNR